MVKNNNHNNHDNNNNDNSNTNIRFNTDYMCCVQTMTTNI